VRKAVLAAADREAYRLERGGELVGPIATHFIPPDIPGFEEAGGEDAAVDYLEDPQGDMQLAAEYMRKAGFESGKYEGPEILVVGENAGVDKRVAEAVRDDLEKLGFKLNFQQVSSDTMYTKFCGVPKAEVHVCPNVGWLKDFNDGQAIVDVPFHGDSIVPLNNSNWPQLDSPVVNKAIEEARLIVDPAERAKAWGEVDKLIVEQAPAVPYVWDFTPNVQSANVNGVVNAFNATYDLSFTSIK
jgi:peptide/nickel transport system substrate-binding protein